MNNIVSIKRKIGILINKSPLRPFFEICNLVFFHWRDRQYVSHPGHGDRTYVVIRPQTETQGLLSSYLYVLKYVRWAIENSFIPYVDFEQVKCQYYTGRTIQGSKNAWEYYFKQPYGTKKDNLTSAHTIIYSGWTWLKKNRPLPILKRPESALDQDLLKITMSICPVKQYVIDYVETKYHSMFSGKVLGVFLRGTDYAKLKPKGHAIQPDIFDVINKIDEFLSKYEIDKIFVVTEDLNYFSELKKHYGDIVFSSDDYFIGNYTGEKYIGAAFTNDAYERGLNYLVRILLFGHCDYTISGITNGSVVANLLKVKEPLDSYWFDLGVY